MSKQSFQEHSTVTKHTRADGKFICLRCQKIHEGTEHGKSFECDCGLHYVSFGNGLYFYDPNIKFKYPRGEDDPLVYEIHNEKKIQKFSNVRKKGNKMYSFDDFGMISTLSKEEEKEYKNMFFSDIYSHMITKEIDSQYVKGLKIKEEYFDCPFCHSQYILDREHKYRNYAWSCKCGINFNVGWRTLFAKLKDKEKVQLKVNQF